MIHKDKVGPIDSLSGYISKAAHVLQFISTKYLPPAIHRHVIFQKACTKMKGRKPLCPEGIKEVAVTNISRPEYLLFSGCGIHSKSLQSLFSAVSLLGLGGVENVYLK